MNNLLHNGNDPQLSWEVVPSEETRVGQSVMAHPKAQSILSAFIEGATKQEIARVFGLKEKLVRAVIAAQPSFHPYPNTLCHQ